ncbi:MAG: hypothetical protein FWG33_01890 [Oscillospiraceae bacterium]|nr:hypothetical protein [Oscillospiraceae bacterium]
MNLLNLKSGSIPEILKDSDNVLILVLALMLIKEKSNLPLVIALMSILILDNPPSEQA